MTYEAFLERMKPCPECITCDHCIKNSVYPESNQCTYCDDFSNFEPAEDIFFCEVCGRPLHGNVKSFYYDLINELTSIKWISVKNSLPTDSRTYLCKVLIIEDGGNFSEDYITANYDQKTGKWNCDGMAIMEWGGLEALKDETD